MAIKKILLYPEEGAALRKKSEPVKVVNRRIKRLIQDLEHTLDNHPDGVGLAAPQIDVHYRVVVVRLGVRSASQDQYRSITALVNPVILDADDERRDFDGCLSFPGLYGETVRPHFLRVAGLDKYGEPFDRIFEDFDAVLVHHEIDHLDGILFIDRIQRIEDLYNIAKDEKGRSIRVPLSAHLPVIGDPTFGSQQRATQIERDLKLSSQIGKRIPKM